MIPREVEDVYNDIVLRGESNVRQALDTLIRYGQIDGAHHKTWVIDQAARLLSGSYYEELIRAANNGEDGPETYTWDEGIPP